MRWYLPVALHTLALLVALFVQTTGTMPAGAWLPFHLAGCAVLLYRQQPIAKPLQWWLALAWLITILGSAFFWRAVAGGAVQMSFLIAMPALALCMSREYVKAYFFAFYGVLLAYSIGLGLQWAFDVHYTSFEYRPTPTSHAAVAWPLLDPNNAAVFMGVGLLASAWLTRYFKPCALAAGLFAFCLWATYSKAGMLATGVLLPWMLARQYQLKLSTFAWGAGIVFMCLLPFTDMLHFSAPGQAPLDVLKAAFGARLDIWKTAVHMLYISPLRGIGLGQFYPIYSLLRTEHSTVGVYAHNDVLQFAIEMGLPAAAVFCAMVCAVLWRGNELARAAFMVVLIQSMVEFQFYVPSISILAGLALAAVVQPSALRRSSNPVYAQAPSLPVRKAR